MLDNIDLQILDTLQKNGRAQISKIAKKAGLTIPAISERIRKLESKGVIKGYRAIVDRSAIGKGITAFVFVVNSSSNNYEEFIDKVRDVNEIAECHSITGAGSHLLKIQTENTSTLEKLLNQIQSWRGVMQTKTHIVLSTYKEFSALQPSDSVVKNKI